jgi:hypothetical protein
MTVTAPALRGVRFAHEVGGGRGVKRYGSGCGAWRLRLLLALPALRADR